MKYLNKKTQKHDYEFNRVVDLIKNHAQAT